VHALIHLTVMSCSVTLLQTLIHEAQAAQGGGLSRLSAAATLSLTSETRACKTALLPDLPGTQLSGHTGGSGLRATTLGVQMHSTLRPQAYTAPTIVPPHDSGILHYPVARPGMCGARSSEEGHASHSSMYNRCACSLLAQPGTSNLCASAPC